jgi:protein O-GlcNAc transferase
MAQLPRGELSKVEDQFRRATAAFQTGNVAEAERLYRKVLRAQPKHLGALNILGVLLTRTGQNEEAERFIRAALAISPQSEATQYNHGLVLKALKRLPEALAAFDKALALNAKVPDNWNSRGSVLNELKRFDDALRDFDKAIALKPDLADAFYNKGNAQQGLKQYDAALESYDAAITLNPGHPLAYNNRGTALLKLRRAEDALVWFDRALAINPSSGESHVGRGDVFLQLRRFDDAIAAYQRALALNPEVAEAWLGCGNTFLQLRRYNEAASAFDRALAIKSDMASAWMARADLLYFTGRHEDALQACKQALALTPELRNLTGVLSMSLHVCDWGGLEALSAHVLSEVDRGGVASPLLLLSIPSTAQQQLTCARSYIADQRFKAASCPSTRHTHERIRIGYVSYDLRAHAIGFLSAGLFEQHDRVRFETHAISLGPEDGSATRKRMEAAFDQFHDVRLRSDEDIVALMRSLEIDIAVDLGGFTQGERLTVFARRPAPIQVNYLGYPGTMGAEFIDYIISDRIIIPPEQERLYSEKVVCLPDSYQANDDKRQISDAIPSRTQAGLPDEGFVFCSFNNTFKINPAVFDVWMRLLHEIDGSVLWLLEGNATAPGNLRREAEKRGIAGSRLVFAPRATPDDHLARHRLADLFLDTLPYNAHTTASDALWAGVPVVTCLGSTFASRVAGSLLSAAGLPELITQSLADYESLALQLARNLDLLASIKAKLARGRVCAPLFDTARFARNIEAAYVMMWERHRRGEAPASFIVSRCNTSG